MNKLLTLFLLLPFIMFGQVPQGVGYQGVATDSVGIELINQSISIRSSVLSGSATGAIEWQETHITTTDTFGLFNLSIGQGTNTGNGAQTSFADISWGANTHFLKIEMDVNGGTNYSHMGTNQMMSVPYALYAENANINYDSIATILSNDSSFTNVFGSSCTSFGDFITSPNLNWYQIGNIYATYFEQVQQDGFMIIRLAGGTSGTVRFHVFSDTSIVSGSSSSGSVLNVIHNDQSDHFTIPIKEGQFWRFVSGNGSGGGAVLGIMPLVCEGSSTSSSLDSTTIANMIAASGGGSSNLKFPDGVNGEFLTVEIFDDSQNSIPFTVPTGKTFYITSAFAQGDVYITTDNGGLGHILYGAQYSGSNEARKSLINPIILNEGQTISGNANQGSTISLNGFLTNTNITPISWEGVTYQVPVGKKLYITNTGLGANLFIDNIKIDAGAGSQYVLGNPIVVNENQIVNPTNGVFNGYLADDDYFLNSGGSSAGSGNMIVSNFGDTLTLNGQTIIIPGISYSNYVPTYGSVTDIDGNTYQTVLIYGKEWMAEDLLVTNFSNGDAINQITGTNGSSHPNCTSPSYAYETSGSLGPKVWYNGYVVQDSRNVCPTGWHVPTETEYSDLFDLFSDRDTVPPAQQGNGYIYYWEDAGSKLKKPNSGWNTTSNYPFGQATNDSYLGFESYPEPGCTNFSNFYFTTGANRKVYTGTPAPVNGGNYHIQIRDGDDRVDIHDTPSYYLYSVRCVKD